MAHAWIDLKRPGLGWRAAIVPGYLLAYLLLDWISYIHPLQGLNITPWNPQAAVAVALLIWKPRQVGLVFAGLLGAEVIVRGLPISWLATVLSSLVLALGYAAIARAMTDRIGSPAKLKTRRDFVVFLIIVVAGALLNGLLYVAALVVGGGASEASVATAVIRFWIGDAVGLLVTLPLLLMLGDADRRAKLTMMLKTPECWAIATVITLMTWAVFASSVQNHFKLFYILFAPVVWAAARFGLTGAALGAVLTQMLVVVAVQSLQYQELAVFELQSLMAALSATGLLLGTTTDERERAASDLGESLRMAEAGDMAAAMAHELSQSLTALSSYASACQLLAVERTRADSARRAPLLDLANKLVEETKQAGDVVKRLRGFFRSGSTQLQMVDVPRLVEAVTASQLWRAHALGVALDWSCDPGVPSIWIDRVEIAVVLRNLVGNAIEGAGRDDGQGRVNVTVALERGQVLIRVRAWGAGRSAALTQGLFEPQAPGKRRGTGVGMSICRAIVDVHGGRLWTEPGVHDDYFVSLPVSSGITDE